jgi:addiction module RelB/DinJ family antitoxin
MSDSRLNIRVDADVKVQAEYVFRKLGLNMSSGINIFLSKVAAEQSIPFTLSIDRAAVIGKDEYRFEQAAVAMVHESIAESKYNALPIARYDDEKQCPYLEYPDGSRAYDIED